MQKFKSGIAGILLALGLAGGAHAVDTGKFDNLAGGNSLLNPGIDVYYTQCAAPTQIRAQVTEPGHLPDTIHVTILCVEPLSLLGKGDKEIAQAPQRTISEWAETPGGCKSALVEIGCDHNNTCDDYIVEVECVGQKFLGTGLGQKINR